MRRLYVFDLDGTLVDSQGDIAQAANAARVSLGHAPLPTEVVQGHIGNGARVLMQRVLGPENEAQLEPALLAFFAHYEAHLFERTKVYPGLVKLLRALDGPAAVLTNKPGTLARPLCDALGLSPLLQAVWGEGDVPARKPDPRGVVSLCARFDVASAHARFVGDSSIDAATARIAGIPFVGVTWGYGTEQQMRGQGAACFASTADQLLQALKG